MIGTQEKFLVIFLVWISISMLVNGNLLVRNRDMGLVILYYLKIGLMYFLIVNTVRSIRQLKILIGIFVICALVLAVEGIQHKFSGVGWAGQSLGWIDPAVIAAGGSGRTRWIGIFDGPGVFCVVYTVALPFLLAATKKGFPQPLRIIAIVSTILVFLAIYFTGSRGGLISTMTIIVLHFGLHFGQKIAVSKGQVVLFVVVALAAILLAPAHLTNIDDSQKSSYHRIEMWEEGLEMVFQNPIFGIGRGNFREYTSNLVAHSSPIEIMGESGAVGLFLWLGIIYIAIKNAYLFVRQESQEGPRTIAKAVIIAIVGYLVSSMFVSLEYETFYILLAWGSALGKNVTNNWSFSKRDFWSVAGATVVWIGISYFAVYLYKITYF